MTPAAIGLLAVGGVVVTIFGYSAIASAHEGPLTPQTPKAPTPPKAPTKCEPQDSTFNTALAAAVAKGMPAPAAQKLVDEWNTFSCPERSLCLTVPFPYGFELVEANRRFGLAKLGGAVVSAGEQFLGHIGTAAAGNASDAVTVSAGGGEAHVSLGGHKIF